MVVIRFPQGGRAHFQGLASNSPRIRGAYLLGIGRESYGICFQLEQIAGGGGEHTFVMSGKKAPPEWFLRECRFNHNGIVEGLESEGI